MSRSRSCTNPKPSLLGQYCLGNQRQTEQCGNKICKDQLSAFSVDHPYKYNITLTFSHTIYHQGQDFNKTTGTFICSIPGTYHFSVTLVKRRNDTRVDRVYCDLKINGASKIHIEIDPTDDDTDKGGAAVSESIVLHLEMDDKVYLGACNGPPSNFMDYWTTFTGFLLYPDN